MRIRLIVDIGAEHGMFLDKIRDGLKDIEVELGNTLRKFGAIPSYVRITSYKETVEKP